MLQDMQVLWLRLDNTYKQLVVGHGSFDVGGEEQSLLNEHWHYEAGVEPP